MDAIKTAYLEGRFSALQSQQKNSSLENWRTEGFKKFSKLGLPTLKNEEWKYTGIGRLFTRDFFIPSQADSSVDAKIISTAAIPGASAMNHIVFVNGIYNKELSHFELNEGWDLCTLEEAFNGQYQQDANAYFNKSNLFIRDGIHALNTSFMDSSLFIKIKKGYTANKPVYFNHVYDTTSNHILASPRVLMVIEDGADVQLIESYHTHGPMDSFGNEVVEIAVKENARLDYIKIQNDTPNGNHAGTTHIRQVGKSFVQTITISLNGGMIRNNTDIIMEAAANEAHMYGLYFLKGDTHVDNHTLVDNTKPLCFSNELYKGIIDDRSTGVFSGKIFVRPDAQKINAYQSNKNILLSDKGTINTKPQLEIYADDVKCSHGCTVGKLDEEALYYLRARGINKELAKSMLLKAFADEIVNQIKNESLKQYVESLVEDRLQLSDQ